MRSFNVHGKRLPVPAFFQVYNFGGGNGDKDREIVYAELTGDTPALVNYYYICNKYPHVFESRLFDDCARFGTVGDLYNHIRAALIGRGRLYRGYSSVPFDFNRKVFLLDSGAFSVIRAIAEAVNFDLDQFNERILDDVIAYYEFAQALKFDVVVGFDMGGKYTEKAGEKQDRRLNGFLAALDAEQMNRRMLEATARYLAAHPDYYPKILATVHGDTPAAYAESAAHILELEKAYGIRFWGFALGGVASYRRVDQVWYQDVDLRKTGRRGFVDTITPARACRIVRRIAGDRPIHALGCGGYNNIALNYFCGATSFDAASPVRRVGDGSLASTSQVFDPAPSGESFSKFFMGGINADGSVRGGLPRYIQLNEVPDDLPLCGCAACRAAGSVHRIKTLYAMKQTDSEANYFSRQLIGLHAVLQHRKLCEVISAYESMEAFAQAYETPLTQGLQSIGKQL